jgi:cupin fold WbuC family metalloprotein
MRTRILGSEVHYADEPVVKVASAITAELCQGAAKNPNQRMRLCTHTNENDVVHEMLIALTRASYVRPHKHVGKPESFHIIDGVADVILFDDQGRILDVIRMTDYRSGGTFYYRLAAPCFHTVCVESDVLLFHETTQGPFDRASTVFPTWAPDGLDPEAALAYATTLRRAVAAWR